VQRDIFILILDGNLSGVKELITKERSVVNLRDKLGRTPLMEAVIKVDLSIVRELLSSGAEVNLHESAGWTALHFAAQAYSYEICKILLENNAEVDAVDNQGSTPLFRSLFGSKGRGEVIELLLNYGADKNKQNNSGNSPLKLAEQVTNFNLKEYFKNA
jgi:uncharacterized protein